MATAVRIDEETHARLTALVELIASQGWAAVGVERKDPVSIGAVVDEATRILADRTVSPKEKKR